MAVYEKEIICASPTIRLLFLLDLMSVTLSNSNVLDLEGENLPAAETLPAGETLPAEETLPTEKTLNELLDLSLGSPEVVINTGKINFCYRCFGCQLIVVNCYTVFQVGAVNFNILHTLLSSILKRLDLQNVITEVDSSKYILDSFF
ncbi:unnamed protein product [Clavelina lepadiformis]|uniref:Uncharacterized protein n=1 Tax=Clavelina lepadiformis TaxID=159417 RepID=A0ABP0FDP2_CLALP